MKFSEKILSQTITQRCIDYGIEHIVISPGSRNAPLTIGFTERESFTNYSIVDERCAAFFGLGLAQQIKKPVALVCTSGSALLNYYPAIAEAFYSDIPLVVISADRPASHIEIGDGQTIMQENVFGKHILYAANCKEGQEHQAFNEAQINAALRTTITKQGPVHINVPFSEPLYNKVATSAIMPKNKVLPQAIALDEAVLNKKIHPFVEQWNGSTKKMILVGVLAPGSIEQQLLDKIAADPGVLVLTETTSNLHQDRFFPAIDQLIASLDEAAFKEIQPDVLLTFGGMVVSKKVKAMLRSFPPKMHWHVDVKKAYDTYFVLDAHVEAPPSDFLQLLINQSSPKPSDYQETWQKIRMHRLKMHEAYVHQIGYSDFKVFAAIFATLPKNIQLQLSNSATVRYAQLFDIKKEIAVFCNRGTSGIDGSTSTAIGAAVGSSKPTVFLTGDLSFFYDSNALWNNYMPENFKIIIVNNSGGGIFRILKGAKETQHFDTYFETKHQLTAEQLASMFGLNYDSVAHEEDLNLALKNFFLIDDVPCILEIFTPADVNDAILLAYFDFIK